MDRRRGRWKAGRTEGRESRIQHPAAPGAPKARGPRDGSPCPVIRLASTALPLFHPSFHARAASGPVGRSERGQAKSTPDPGPDSRCPTRVLDSGRMAVPGAGAGPFAWPSPWARLPPLTAGASGEKGPKRVGLTLSDVARDAGRAHRQGGIRRSREFSPGGTARGERAGAGMMAHLRRCAATTFTPFPAGQAPRFSRARGPPRASPGRRAGRAVPLMAIPLLRRSRRVRPRVRKSGSPAPGRWPALDWCAALSAQGFLIETGTGYDVTPAKVCHHSNISASRSRTAWSARVWTSPSPFRSA